jgi:hypothetical protein
VPTLVQSAVPSTGSPTGPPTGPAAVSAPRASRLRISADPRTWTTPVQLRAFTAAALSVTIVLGIVLAVSTGDVRDGLRRIGHQMGPQVVATSDLYFALNDMDAQVANVLLVGREQGLGVGRDQALAIYEQRRAQADHDLQQAAAAAGNDPVAAQALRGVLDALGRYEALASQALLLDQQGNHLAGRPPAAAVDLYRQATGLMKSTVLPAARNLTTANATALDHTYTAKRANATQAAVWVGLLALALLGILAGLQLYLIRRHHRLFSPAIGVATVAAAALLIAGVSVFTTEAEDLRVAKKDAFDSVLALSLARAISYDGNADESRFLVDPARAAQYQQSYFDKSQQIVGYPSTTLLSYEEILPESVKAVYGPSHAVRFSGYLGAEFRNITFPGERAAAEQTLTAYEAYQKDDLLMRQYASNGQLRKAIELDTSYAPGNSNHDFGVYDQALSSVIAINQKAFDQAISDGEGGLNGWTYVPPIGVVLLIGLVLAGVRPRLAEYR